MGFTLTARLGRGRTVESFSGKTDPGGQMVVVKRPIPQLSADETYAQAFLQWGKSLTRLHDGTVVEVLEVGTDETGPFIVTDRIYGAPLRLVLGELRRRKRTLRPELAFNIAHELARGLAYLHEQHNQIHGGIDPGDVMVGYAGDVRLADVGLHLLDTGDPERFAQESTYLPPEQLQGQGASKAGDVFAFALVTIEMMIGQAVWTSPKMTVEAAVAAMRDFSHIAQAQPALTEDLVTVLGLCVEPRIESRLPSGHELEAELTRIASKNNLAPDDAALGSFVRALLPEPSADEAPTMLVSTVMPTDEEINRSPEVRAASVVIDPEDLVRALQKAESVPEIVVSGRIDPAETTAGLPSATGPLDFIPGGEAGAWKLIIALAAVATILLIILIFRTFGS